MSNIGDFEYDPNPRRVVFGSGTFQKHIDLTMTLPATISAVSGVYALTHASVYFIYVLKPQGQLDRLV
jgi:hypothetical protein